MLFSFHFEVELKNVKIFQDIRHVCWYTVTEVSVDLHASSSGSGSPKRVTTWPWRWRQYRVKRWHLFTNYQSRGWRPERLESSTPPLREPQILSYIAAYSPYTNVCLRYNSYTWWLSLHLSRSTILNVQYSAQKTRCLSLPPSGVNAFYTLFPKDAY